MQSFSSVDSDSIKHFIPTAVAHNISEQCISDSRYYVTALVGQEAEWALSSEYTNRVNVIIISSCKTQYTSDDEEMQNTIINRIDLQCTLQRVSCLRDSCTT